MGSAPGDSNGDEVLELAVVPRGAPGERGGAPGDSNGDEVLELAVVPRGAPGERGGGLGKTIPTTV